MPTSSKAAAARRNASTRGPPSRLPHRHQVGSGIRPGWCSSSTLPPSLGKQESPLIHLKWRNCGEASTTKARWSDLIGKFCRAAHLRATRYGGHPSRVRLLKLAYVWSAFARIHSEGWLAIRSSLCEVWRAKDGGPDRDRTGDLMNAIHARSQLRYWPTFGEEK
jgi:hypothetical protein